MIGIRVSHLENRRLGTECSSVMNATNELVMLPVFRNASGRIRRGQRVLEFGRGDLDSRDSGSRSHRG